LNSQSYSGNCRGLEKKPVYLNSGLGEEVGLDSRCIEGDFVTSGTPVERATCHRVTCDGNTATIHIGSATVECSPGDGKKTVEGYEGHVYCPDTNILCLAVACPNNCNGVGKCENGVCQCDNGNVGGDCGTITSGGTT